MRRILIAVAVPFCFAPGALVGQRAIPVTVAQAEAEAAIAAPRDTASVPQAFFSQPFAGTNDRRCIVANDVEDVRATGSLRSGEMIVRGPWYNPTRLRAGLANKFLWLPLNGSPDMRAPLVVRAGRVGDPADSVRVSVERLAHGGGNMYGYPSLVTFPTAGRWLVVATAGSDWGCFIIDVSKVSTH